MVTVETFGKKEHTSTQYGVTNCVFDELLIFNLKGIILSSVDLLLLGHIPLAYDNAASTLVSGVCINLFQ